MASWVAGRNPLFLPTPRTWHRQARIRGRVASLSLFWCFSLVRF